MEKGNDSSAKITIRWGSRDEIPYPYPMHPMYPVYPVYPVYPWITYPQIFPDSPIQTWITWGLTI